jgi:NADH-quinone oxidoreductase subunit J
MEVISIIFYFLAAMTILSGIFVITARNPVHSVLWLIMCFFSTAGLFIILGAEFLAMLIMIVYVGAVAVLFLFVVMMLDVDFVELKQGFTKYLPFGLGIGFLIIFELALVIFNWDFLASNSLNLKFQTPEGVSNTIALSKILYTDFVYLFQSAGLILFVAMIGAIVLTLRHKPSVKRQNITDQIHRDAEQSITMVDVKPGQGL